MINLLLSKDGVLVGDGLTQGEFFGDEREASTSS